MRMFDTVAIVGTGLIGGSIALDLKKHGLCRCVIGVSRHAHSLQVARAKKAVDRASVSLEVIRDADLVVLATPVDTILALAPRIRGLIRPDCVVMDVASTKETVARRLHRIFPRFVATHPLAGSEKRGVANARPGLFRGSLCIVTPLSGTDPKALAAVQKIWKKLGCRIAVCDPRTHDRIIGMVSHLPHIIAFALVNCVPRDYVQFCPQSLKDMTRIAASDPGMWQEILLDNRAGIAGALKRFDASYARLIACVRARDRAALTRFLRQARAKREAVP